MKNFSDSAARTLRSQVVDIGLRHSSVHGNVKVSDEWKYLSNCEDDRGIYYVGSVFRITWTYHLQLLKMLIHLRLYRVMQKYCYLYPNSCAIAHLIDRVCCQIDSRDHYTYYATCCH